MKCHSWQYRECGCWGTLENEDGWKWSWVVHEGVLHVWGPFDSKWNKLK